MGLPDIDNIPVLKPEKVTHVSCGRAHTLICTGDQKIFACGSDQESQLGRGQQSVGDSSSSPVLIYDCGLAGPKIIQVAAGSHHSLALISDGSVFAWGSNLEGQLGLSGISGLVNKPTKIHLPEPIKQISAGYYHSAFLTESKNVYVCGEAESGKLGIALDFRTQVAPKQMPLPVSAAVIACGGHHTLILGDNGNIYCTGSNASGQLGMGMDVTEIQTPKELPRGALDNEKIVKMVCGESHIAIITESGKLFTCGDGRHGKLGLEENENNVHQLTHATKYQELYVTNVSCGGCHTILVGQRRNEENESEESKQMKLNSLPPLKVPSARIQSDDQSKSEVSIEEVEKGENEPAEKKTDLTTDTKTENPKNTSADTNGMDNPTESPTKSLQSEVLALSPSKASMNGVNESMVDNEEIGEKNERVEILNSEKSGMEIMSTEIDAIERPKSSKSHVSMAVNDEKTKTDDSAINDDTITVEKPSAPPLPIPPPKPPRQKIESAGSNGSNESATIDKKSPPLFRNTSGKSSNGINIEAKNGVSPVKCPIEIEANGEKSPGNKSESSNKSSQSVKSIADTNETIDIETNIKDTLNEIENFKEQTVEKIEEKLDIIADDADVVQSPASKAGKLAKLFKGKRQDVENGTKSSCIPTTKAKSKTCSIL
ncbi:hypothetical protein PV328_005341 [Microctonus aethiopoides]|uniref:RCC1-like domain-containing protein n=1 Tax=Microctonus aethiopoides TaxID=144406 RepID=A0AA39KS99_9HYME|nr:hypothetical protein PV328_005341 [Microctonus aethiopoides]